jgi:hypothetical protein
VAGWYVVTVNTPAGALLVLYQVKHVALEVYVIISMLRQTT